MRSLSRLGQSISKPCVPVRGAVARRCVMLVVLGLTAGIAPAGAAAQEVAVGVYGRAGGGRVGRVHRHCSECHGADLRGSSHGPDLDILYEQVLIDVGGERLLFTIGKDGIPYGSSTGKPEGFSVAAKPCTRTSTSRLIARPPA